MLDRVAEMAGVEYAHWLLSITKDDREAADAGEVHALVGVSPGRSALAAPGYGRRAARRDLEGQGHPDADGKHRRRWLTIV
jgi:hypothetical protein